jgi:hypothetical protein
MEHASGDILGARRTPSACRRFTDHSEHVGDGLRILVLGDGFEDESCHLVDNYGCGTAVNTSREGQEELKVLLYLVKIKWI